MKRLLGRSAHEGHKSRVGQSWKQSFGLACVVDPGMKMYRKVVRIEGDRHFSCSSCGETVRFDDRGYAFCQCLVWNEKAEWTPRKGEHGHSHLNKFIGKCKA